MRTASSGISISRQKIAESGERTACSICRLDLAIGFVNGITEIAVCVMDAEGNVIGRYFVQVATGNQTVLSRTNIGNAQAEVSSKLALKRRIELFDTRSLKIERNRICCERGEVSRIANADRAAAERCNSARVDTTRQTLRTAFGYALVERIRGEGIAHSLRRRRWIVDPITPTDDILVSEPPRDTEPWSEVVSVRLHQATAHSRLIGSDHAVANKPRIEQRQCLLARNDKSTLKARVN